MFCEAFRRFKKKIPMQEKSLQKTDAPYVVPVQKQNENHQNDGILGFILIQRTQTTVVSASTKNYNAFVLNNKKRLHSDIQKD